MNRIRCLLLALLMGGTFFYFPVHTFAHTGLASSNPAADQTVEPIQTIVLNFETQIEEGGSLRVYPEEEESAPLSGTLSQQHKRMQLKWDRPLTAGDYRVDWKIIGTDGHPIEGTYTFTVASNQKENVPTTEKTSDIQQKMSEQEEEKSQNDVSREANDGSAFSILIVGILLILVAYFFYRIVFKERKR